VSHVDVWTFIKDIVFGKRGLDCSKKLGIFCVDGAMMDMHEMVKADAPQALLHHAGGHIWALRIGDVYTELIELAAFDSVKHDFHTYFGPRKGLKMLGAVCISLGLPEFQPNNLSPIRWTGRGTACDSEMRLFQPGCIVLQNQIMHQSDKKKKKKAADLLHRVAEMEHLATLHGMTDLLDQENIICKSMQLKFGRINHLKAAVAGHCEWLQKRYIQPRYVLGGPHMGALYYAMNEQPSLFGTCQFSYQGVKIRGANLGALELATNTLRTAAKFLLHGANKRFPDVEVISALGIFEPTVVRSRIHEDGFGDAEIAILAKQFGGTLCTMNLQVEWHYLREFLRYRVVGILGKDGQSFWQPLLYESEQGGVYPDCVVMLELWLCSVHLSLECERIFRDVSQIRSRFRKALHIRTVEILVKIRNNTPQDVLEFNLVGAAARWMRLKNRAKLCFDGDLSNMS
jgi:hypothetical protein